MLLRHWNEATDGTPDQKAQSPPYRPRIARNDTSSAATGWRLRFLVSSISCFVQSSRTGKCSGPDGQSPLPKKISAISRLPPPKQCCHPRRDAFTAWMIITAWLPNDRCGICGLTVERNVCCFVLFRRTSCVDRDLGGIGIRLDQLVLHQVLFHFFATDVGKHLAINLDARRKRLATFLFHLPTERRLLDDVLFLIRTVVLS